MSINLWNLDGTDAVFSDSAYDLINIPEKHQLFIEFFIRQSDRFVHTDEYSHRNCTCTLIARKEVSFEEGEGL